MRQFKPDESGQTLSQINNARSPCHLAHRLYSFNQSWPQAVLAYRLVALAAESSIVPRPSHGICETLIGGQV